MRIIIYGIVILLVFVTVALSKSSKSNSLMAQKYFYELSKAPKSSSVKSADQKFLKLFKDFKKGATEKNIRETYAEEFYFNDTFKVLNNIDDLIKHLVDTAQMVKSTTVEILDVVQSDTDYYIRWVMIMEFDVKGKDIYSKSIGMSQLRFNNDGKIIFHQDYWDSTEGFYQHLPYIGYFIRKIRSKL